MNNTFSKSKAVHPSSAHHLQRHGRFAFNAAGATSIDTLLSVHLAHILYISIYKQDVAVYGPNCTQAQQKQCQDGERVYKGPGGNVLCASTTSCWLLNGMARPHNSMDDDSLPCPPFWPHWETTTTTSPLHPPSPTLAPAPHLPGSTSASTLASFPHPPAQLQQPYAPRHLYPRPPAHAPSLPSLLFTKSQAASVSVSCLLPTSPHHFKFSLVAPPLPAHTVVSKRRHLTACTVPSCLQYCWWQDIALSRRLANPIGGSHACYSPCMHACICTSSLNKTQTRQQTCYRQRLQC